MRLTLRTMLAWLDDVLDPADSETLGQKIAANDFASNLVQRIRSVIGKLRLGAPKPIGVGIGRDGNSVAEYLDGQLPEERVAEFEKTCLESDILLAETACCHQILSLVLHKPANVSTDLRDRVYDLGRAEAAAHAAAAAATPPAEKNGSNAPEPPAPPAPPVADPVVHNSPPPEPPTPKHSAADVPDYMKTGPGVAIWPYLGVVALVFVLAFIALRAMGPFDSTHPLAALVQPTEEEVASADNAEEMAAPEIEMGGDLSPGDFSDIGPGGGAEIDPSTIDFGKPGKPRTAFDDDLEKTEIVIEDAGPPPVAVTPKNGDAEPIITDDAPPGLPTGEGDGPLVTESEDGPPGAAPPGLEGGSGDVKPPVEPPMPPEVVDDGSGLPGPEGVPATGGKVIGRSLPGEEVLAYRNPESGAWFRLDKSGPILSGREFRVLPGFRPQLTLDIGLRMTLMGETSLRFVTLEDEKAPPVCEMSEGRLFITTGKAGTTLPFAFAGRYGFIDFPDADSRMAVEVNRFRPSGAPSTAENIVVEMRLIALSGRIIWRDEDREATLKAGEAISVSTVLGYAEEGPIELPEWITTTEVVTIERKSIPFLEPELDFERPLIVSLLEQTDHRRIEVRSVAARALADLNYYEPLLNTLNNDEFRSFWMAHFAALQKSLARDAGSAELIKKAVDKTHVDGARDVYHMLVGFTQEQLETGGDALLVEFLESDRLDHRVLAWANLDLITGTVHSFRPEASPTSRRASVGRWRTLLEKDQIRYPTPESTDDESP